LPQDAAQHWKSVMDLSSRQQPEWLSLTDLGRLYGLSAVTCGRLLSEAGLRRANGDPSRLALHRNLALQPHQRGHHRSVLWQRQGCGTVLEQQGVQPLARQRLVGQWADLLEALVQGAAAVVTSAEEMAGELPGELVVEVNQVLQARGSSFRVGAGLRPGAGPRPAAPPAPTAHAADPHRCD
jgi:hypothetical protein